MTDITFNAEKREKAGKGAARACRREGRVPAVIYGNKQEPVMISLHPVELEKALDLVGFYDADIEIVLGGKKIKVSCQDVQFHPVSDKPIHVDFLRK
ncbi:MAG: 50S ribosomal protein L25 [Azospirillum sp.]|nr:50S ribosomal protein L25 [Azospirillum sp.]